MRNLPTNLNPSTHHLELRQHLTRAEHHVPQLQTHQAPRLDVAEVTV